MVQKKIFITYARENADRIIELSKILTMGGYVPWFDKELLPGQNWKDELAKAIETCDAYFYTITKDVLASEWCEWEYIMAIKYGKTIIPILLEPGIKAPDALCDLQFCDFTAGITAAETARLMHALESMQKVPESMAPVTPIDPQGAPSRLPETLWKEFSNWYVDLGIKKSQQANHDEIVLDKFIANRIMGVLTASGRLSITNQRLIFEPHKLNVVNLVGGPGELSIPLNEVSELIRTNVLFVPIGLKIKCHSGTDYLFSLYGRDKLIRLINEQRGS